MMTEHTILVQIAADLPDPDRLDAGWLEQAALQTLAIASTLPETLISIMVTTDEQVKALNKQYRGIDAPTDVLSFPADPLPPEIAEMEGGTLGDLTIGLPYVARRVANGTHSIQDELALLVVHGTLHLLGYDHDTQERQAEMWTIQQDVLTALGIDLKVPDYVHD